MKSKYLEIITIFLISLLFFNCQKGEVILGNYSNCYLGEYSEVYFKKDSMRVASKSEWIKLSEWRKIEIKNDTLYFETFGEHRDLAKAKINYIESNKIELAIYDGAVISLKPIKGNLNFDEIETFWDVFSDRQNSSNCKLK